jgi:hypothetical protein
VTRSRSSLGPIVLGALLLAATVLLLGSASGASADPRASGLEITRPSGDVIPFRGTPTVRCGPWEQGVRRRTIHVLLRNADRAWELRVVLADVASGQRIRFPTSITDARPHGGFFFVAVRQPLVEASTNEEEASGSLFFSQASCRPGAAVSFTVHALLGSELFEGRKVRVDGTFTGAVG